MTKLNNQCQTGKNFLFSPSLKKFCNPGGVINFNRSPLLLGEHDRKNDDLEILKPSENQKLTIYTDWVEFTAKTSGSTLICAKNCDFTIKELERGSQYFRKVFEIFYKNQKVALLEVVPRVSFLSADLVKIKLENIVNYAYDVQTVVNDIVRAFNLNFINYTRVDFAIDFQEIAGFSDVQTFLRKIVSGEIAMKRKELSINITSTGKINGVSFGKRVSGEKITIYNKTVELKKSGKTYISDSWRAAGFDEKKETYRLEFSCRKPRYDAVSADGETIGSFSSQDFLTVVNNYTMFLINANKFFFRDNYGTFKKKIGFVIICKNQISRFKRFYGVIKNRATNLKKSMLKHLTLEALFFQKRRDKLRASVCWDIINEMAARYNLRDWFGRTIPFLSIEPAGFTGLDYLTARDLKDYRFSVGNFSQKNINFDTK